MLTLVAYGHDKRGHRVPERYCQRSYEWPHQYVIYYFATGDDGERIIDLSDVTVLNRTDFGHLLVDWISNGCEVERE